MTEGWQDGFIIDLIIDRGFSERQEQQDGADLWPNAY